MLLDSDNNDFINEQTPAVEDQPELTSAEPQIATPQNHEAPAADHVDSDEPASLVTTFEKELEEEDEAAALTQLKPVPMELLDAWRQSGGWDAILMHLKAGNAYAVTPEVLANALSTQQKYDRLLENLQLVVAALAPLMAKRHELAAYFDADSDYFIKADKIKDEAASFMFQKQAYEGKKKLFGLVGKGQNLIEPTCPGLELLKLVRLDLFMEFDVSVLLECVNDSGIPTQNFTDFWKQIQGDVFLKKFEKEVPNE